MNAFRPWLNPRYSADPLQAISSLYVVSYSQAILKFHRPSSLDYRACHGLGYVTNKVGLRLRHGYQIKYIGYLFINVQSKVGFTKIQYS